MILINRYMLDLLTLVEKETVPPKLEPQETPKMITLTESAVKISVRASALRNRLSESKAM